MTHPLSDNAQIEPYFLKIPPVDTSWLKAITSHSLFTWEGRVIAKIGPAKNFGGIAIVLASFILGCKLVNRPISFTNQVVLITSSSLLGLYKHHLATKFIADSNAYDAHFQKQSKSSDPQPFNHKLRMFIVAEAVSLRFTTADCNLFNELKIHYPEASSEELLRCRARLLFEKPADISNILHLASVKFDEYLDLLPYLISSAYKDGLTAQHEGNSVLKKEYVALLLALLRQGKEGEEGKVVQFKATLKDCLEALQISLDTIEGDESFPEELKVGKQPDVESGEESDVNPDDSSTGDDSKVDQSSPHTAVDFEEE